MDIVHPERKKVVNESPYENNTTNSDNNSSNTQNNGTTTTEGIKGDQTNEEQKVKSDL